LDGTELGNKLTHHLGVAFGIGDLEQFEGILRFFVERFKSFAGFSQFRNVLGNALRFPFISPEIGIERLSFELFYLFPSFGKVKDNPRLRRVEPSCF